MKKINEKKEAGAVDVEKKEAVAEKKDGNRNMMIAAAAAVVLVLLAAGIYTGFFSQFFKGKPAVQKSLLDSDAVRLLLKSYDAGAALDDYDMAHTQKMDDEPITYLSLKKKGAASWVMMSDPRGAWEGFFSGNGSMIVCFAYGTEKKCAEAGKNGTVKERADELAMILVPKSAFLKQKKLMEDWIAGGAVAVSDKIAYEKIGMFNTDRVDCTLDISNMTVQKLASLGIDTATQPERIAFWIDRKSGMIIKSHVAPAHGTWGVYDVEYTLLNSTTPEMPKTPVELVGENSFIVFRQKAVLDYQSKMQCEGMGAVERDLCYKGMALEQGSWEICKKINNSDEYEKCSVIIAQMTNNDVLCGKLATMADDCYIAVAGNTGNFELCKMLKNESLGGACIASATEGKKKKDTVLAEMQKAATAKNCNIDLDCKTTGNANQYCTRKNDTDKYADGNSPMFACLKDASCGCNDGRCGFRKNDSYYACIGSIEEGSLDSFIGSKIDESNRTKAN